MKYCSHPTWILSSTRSAFVRIASAFAVTSLVLGGCGDNAGNASSTGAGGTSSTSVVSTTGAGGAGGDDPAGAGGSGGAATGGGGAAAGGGGAGGCGGFGEGTISPPDPSAGLDPNDVTELTSHLEALSMGWVEASVGGANAILSKPQYDADDYRAFFDMYFEAQGHPLSDSLNEYIGYPTFFWFDDAVHIKLQKALTASLRMRAESILKAHAADLGAALDGDAGLRQTLFNAHRMMVNLGKFGVLDEAARRNIFDWYAAYIASYPEYLRPDTAIDTAAKPWVAGLRVQTLQAFTDVMKLGSCDNQNIAERLKLAGRYLDIWSASGVLIHDNLGFNAAQLDAIYGLLVEVPEDIQDLGHITQHELLGNAAPKQAGLFSYRSVNIFDVDIGTFPENSFPSDIAGIDVDVFVGALAHEVNHVVDAHHIGPNPVLNDRKAQLLAQAGTVDLEYLRSMVGGQFFQNAPQEFFASISNEYFTDTRHTFKLGMQRFDQGYKQPINQALFFAEIYSRGTGSTRFYEAHIGSPLVALDVPVTRDGNGRISSLTYDGSTYTFVLDAAGNVSSYSIQ